ncbi:hypothetical protein BP6252_06427 [Coleophoma cylindrospora]|uniref:Uncharacterized protein n=1 Tax=Coleophoma cylindrospora TaxID=1849047 RepID=A0A3D8RMK2_9HELO|nr:hypothetical protein BP6252_06427 [Coleophoma cylindrospora]
MPQMNESTTPSNGESSRTSLSEGKHRGKKQRTASRAAQPSASRGAAASMQAVVPPAAAPQSAGASGTSGSSEAPKKFSYENMPYPDTLLYLRRAEKARYKKHYDDFNTLFRFQREENPHSQSRYRPSGDDEMQRVLDRCLANGGPLTPKSSRFLATSFDHKSACIQPYIDLNRTRWLEAVAQGREIQAPVDVAARLTGTPSPTESDIEESVFDSEEDTITSADSREFANTDANNAQGSKHSGWNPVNTQEPVNLSYAGPPRNVTAAHSPNPVSHLEKDSNSGHANRRPSVRDAWADRNTQLMYPARAHDARGKDIFSKEGAFSAFRQARSGNSIVSSPARNDMEESQRRLYITLPPIRDMQPHQPFVQQPSIFNGEARDPHAEMNLMKEMYHRRMDRRIADEQKFAAVAAKEAAAGRRDTAARGGQASTRQVMRSEKWSSSLGKDGTNGFEGNRNEEPPRSYAASFSSFPSFEYPQPVERHVDVSPPRMEIPFNPDFQSDQPRSKQFRAGTTVGPMLRPIIFDPQMEALKNKFMDYGHTELVQKAAKEQQNAQAELRKKEKFHDSLVASGVARW